MLANVYRNSDFTVTLSLDFPSITRKTDKGFRNTGTPRNRTHSFYRVRKISCRFLSLQQTSGYKRVSHPEQFTASIYRSSLSAPASKGYLRESSFGPISPTAGAGRAVYSGQGEDQF